MGVTADALVDASVTHLVGEDLSKRGAPGRAARVVERAVACEGVSVGCRVVVEDMRMQALSRLSNGEIECWSIGQIFELRGYPPGVY